MSETKFVPEDGAASRLHGADALLYDALESIFLSIDKYEDEGKTSYANALRFIPQRGLAIRRAIKHWSKIYHVLDSSRTCQNMPYDADRLDRLVNIAMDRDMCRDLVHPLAGSHGLHRVTCYPSNVYMWQGFYSSTSVPAWITLYTKTRTCQRFLNQHHSWPTNPSVRSIAFFIRPRPTSPLRKYESHGNGNGKRYVWHRQWYDHIHLPLSLTSRQRDNMFLLCTKDWYPIETTQNKTGHSSMCLPENVRLSDDMALSIANLDDVELVHRFYTDTHVLMSLNRNHDYIPTIMGFLVNAYFRGTISVDSAIDSLNYLCHIVLDSGKFVPFRGFYRPFSLPLHSRYDIETHDITLSFYNTQRDKHALSAIKLSYVLQPLLDISTGVSLKEMTNGKINNATWRQCIINELCWRDVCRKNESLLPRQEHLILELANVISTNELIVEIIIMESGWFTQNPALQSKLRTMVRRRVSELTRLSSPHASIV